MDGIDITLRDSLGLLRGVATTNSDGAAEFSDLAPDTYTLWVDASPSYRTTTPHPITVQLSANDFVQTELGLASALPPHYLPFLLQP